MRAWSAFLALAFVAAPAFADASPKEQKITVETDTYRFGDLYRSDRGTTAEACAKTCDREMACAAWSLTPATFRLGPRCELKRTPGTANHRPGAISGMSKVWQMDADRHGEMRYRTSVPESRQPAAVPLEQLRPSPVPRVFGDPLPKAEPELLGGPASLKDARAQTPAQVMPVQSAPARSVEVLRAPGEGEVPQYVKQPAPDEPHPLYKEPIRQPAQPAAASRAPWTERDGTAPNYSVGSGFIPWDEDATAGYVEGVPDAGS